VLSIKDAVAHAQHGDAKVPVLHDPVTGVFNRPLLVSAISQEIRRAERYGGDFSIVSCGLRGHEGFRRDFGSELADRLVVYVSMVLSQTVREADVIARVSEDSFAILLPGTPAEQLPPLLTRLATRFELARFQVDGRMVRTPVALGQVSFPDTVGTAPRLLEAALEDLGRVKLTRSKLSSSRLAL
jgi:diguanylate cyclase (GGDEF)-like protein